MSQDLDEALGYLLEEEGGWSNNVNDSGGKTMFGVTQATYDAYKLHKGLATQPVNLITHEEARDLYDTMYWRTAYCDKLPWPISYLTFDAAVNSGPSRSVKWTQAGLGVSADGAVGPGTLAAASTAVSTGDAKTILSIVDQRVQFLCNIVKNQPTQLTFLLGWWRRTQRVLSRALVSEIA